MTNGSTFCGGQPPNNGIESDGKKPPHLMPDVIQEMSYLVQ